MAHNLMWKGAMDAFGTIRTHLRRAIAKLAIHPAFFTYPRMRRASSDLSQQIPSLIIQQI